MAEQMAERFVYLEAPPQTRCPDCGVVMVVVAAQVPDSTPTPLDETTWVLACPDGETMWEWRPVR